jgi:hypothetical protein
VRQPIQPTPGFKPGDNDALIAGVVPRGPVRKVNPLARAAAEERSKWQCEMPWCRADTFLVLHHLTYDRAGRELASDVIMVCEPCHDEIHEEPRVWAKSVSYHSSDGKIFIPGWSDPPDEPW